MTTDTALVPTAQDMPPAHLTALEKYGRSGGDLFGDLLKFSGKTGIWTFGAQSVELAAGTQLVAIVPAMLAGFVKWLNGELVEQALVPITEDHDLRELRASLGDADDTKWPTGDDGRRADPWKEAAYLPLMNPKTGAKYTYSTSSLGGCRAVKKLARTFAWQIRAAPETTANHLPVVELGAHSYKHEDRKRGTIFNPLLTGVDWVPASTVADKHSDQAELPLDDAPTSFEDHSSEKTKKHRKASL